MKFGAREAKSPERKAACRRLARLGRAEPGRPAPGATGPGDRWAWPVEPPRLSSRRLSPGPSRRRAPEQIGWIDPGHEARDDTPVPVAGMACTALLCRRRAILEQAASEGERGALEPDTGSHRSGWPVSGEACHYMLSDISCMNPDRAIAAFSKYPCSLSTSSLK